MAPFGRRRRNRPKTSGKGVKPKPQDTGWGSPGTCGCGFAKRSGGCINRACPNYYGRRS